MRPAQRLPRGSIKGARQGDISRADQHGDRQLSWRWAGCSDRGPDVVEAQSMRRRDFLAAICGAITTLPSLARAQSSRIPGSVFFGMQVVLPKKGRITRAFLKVFETSGTSMDATSSSNIAFPTNAGAISEHGRRAGSAQGGCLGDGWNTDCTLRQKRDHLDTGRFHLRSRPGGQWFRRQPGTAGRI